MFALTSGLKILNIILTIVISACFFVAGCTKIPQACGSWNMSLDNF